MSEFQSITIGARTFPRVNAQEASVLREAQRLRDFANESNARTANTPSEERTATTRFNERQQQRALREAQRLIDQAQGMINWREEQERSRRR